jgi:hypothetical protein
MPQGHGGLVCSIHQTADNSHFELIRIVSGEASISDFSGAPPKTFSF